MSSRFTLRANALSFIFFRTDFASTSASDFPGFTSAHAVMNPASSSQANRALSIGVSRRTPVQLGVRHDGAANFIGSAALFQNFIPFIGVVLRACPLLVIKIMWQVG